MNRDVIITCAVTGAGDTVAKHDGVPVTPENVAEAAISAAKAGAAIAHIHVRDPETGQGSRDVALCHPDWSPDGKKLAFASNRSGQFEIWTVNADGNDLKMVTTGAGAKVWPAWSPDGKSLMFTRKDKDGYSLWIINADGTGSRKFQPDGLGRGTQLRDADWK